MQWLYHISYTTEVICHPPPYFAADVPVMIVPNPEYSIITQQDNRKWASRKVDPLRSGLLGGSSISSFLGAGRVAASSLGLCSLGRRTNAGTNISTRSHPILQFNQEKRVS